MPTFTDFCRGFFSRYFELHPTEAIHYGVPGYDHRLKDFTDEAYRDEKVFAAESLKRLREVSVKGLSPDETLDYALLEGRLTLDNYEFEKEDYLLRSAEHNLSNSHFYILTV